MNTPNAGPDAHRPTVANRLRLVPLAVLVLCVLAATVVGALSDSAVSSESRAAQGEPGREAASVATDREAAARRADDPCVPGWNPGIKGEPWQGGRRAASERAYAKAIAKEDPAYVRGRKGWHFFTDYQVENFSQAVGRVVHTKAERRAWGRFLTKQQKTVEGLGSKYFVSVSPGNWAVYRQFLPAWAQRLRGSVSLDRLMKDYPKVNWIDTRPALRRAEHRTYEPLNSHWTPYGGYVAWQAISACLRARGLDGVGVPPLRKVKIEKNLNEFAVNGVPDGKPQRTVPVYRSKHPRTVIRHIPDGKVLDNVADHSVDMLLLPVRTTTKKAATDKTLLVLRDSTGSALSPLWSSSFRTTIQYNHGLGTNLADPPNLAKLVKKHDPDVVLFVMTERFFSLDPGA